MDLVAEAVGGATNVEIVHGVAEAAELATYYEAADVVLSLHRAEGFGLTIAEAMLRSKPVV